MNAVIPGTSLAIHPEQFPDVAENLPANGITKAVLGGGCFWCVEAVYLNLEGVNAVVSGYAGGHAARANYEAVCTGTTGHAEVIEVEYDSAVISFGELLKVFFSVAHDPTQKDRQGNDRGTQYRSAIFFITIAPRKPWLRHTSSSLTTLALSSPPLPPPWNRWTPFTAPRITIKILPAETRRKAMLPMWPNRKWKS